LAANGAIVLDIRPVAEFIARHHAGALFVDFDRRSFLPLVRLFVPPEAPLVVIAADVETARTARALLEGDGRRVADVMASTAVRQARLESLPIIDVGHLAERLATGDRDFQLVDVRQSFEWKLGSIEGASHVPLKALAAEAERWQPDDEILCVCEQGVRSATAASFLRRRGFVNAKSVDGGIEAWASSGRALKEE